MLRSTSRLLRRPWIALCGAALVATVAACGVTAGTGPSCANLQCDASGNCINPQPALPLCGGNVGGSSSAGSPGVAGNLPIGGAGGTGISGGGTASGGAATGGGAAGGGGGAANAGGQPAGSSGEGPVEGGAGGEGGGGAGGDGGAGGAGGEGGEGGESGPSWTLGAPP